LGVRTPLVCSLFITLSTTVSGTRVEDVGSIPEVDDINHLFAAVLAKSLFRASSQNSPPADTSHIRSFPTDEAISSALVHDTVVDNVKNKLRTSGFSPATTDGDLFQGSQVPWTRVKWLLSVGCSTSSMISLPLVLMQHPIF